MSDQVADLSACEGLLARYDEGKPLAQAQFSSGGRLTLFAGPPAIIRCGALPTHTATRIFEGQFSSWSLCARCVEKFQRNERRYEFVLNAITERLN